MGLSRAVKMGEWRSVDWRYNKKHEEDEFLIEGRIEVDVDVDG